MEHHREYIESLKENKRVITEEEFEILRHRSIVLGVMAGMLEDFYDKNSENIETGLARLLKVYYQMKLQDADHYLAKAKEDKLV